MKTELCKVPHFIFYQNVQDEIEHPIIVRYYNGTISLEYNGESILIVPDLVKDLFKEIERHKPQAAHWLNK